MAIGTIIIIRKQNMGESANDFLPNHNDSYGVYNRSFAYY